MGILSSIFGKGKKKHQKQNVGGNSDLKTEKGDQNKSDTVKEKREFPLGVSLSFTPFRLKEHKDGHINLIINLTNKSGENQLVSLDLLLPKNELLGFDSTCVNKYLEKRVGTLSHGETVSISLPVWGNNQTRTGNYPLEVRVYTHYLKYDKVVSYMKKRTYVRVV